MIPINPFTRPLNREPRPDCWKEHPFIEPEPEILPDEQPLPNPDENRNVTLYFIASGEGSPAFHAA